MFGWLNNNGMKRDLQHIGVWSAQNVFMHKAPFSLEKL